MKSSITTVVVTALALMIGGTCYAKDNANSLENAEAKVLKVANPDADRSLWAQKNAKAISQFENIIKKNPQSMDYGFDKIKDCGLVEIIESEDHNLRFYQWNTSGGTMMCYTVWRQCRKPNGKVETVRLCGGKEGDCGGSREIIAQIKTKNGETVYLVRSFFKADSFSGNSTLEAIKIGGNGANNVKFNRDGKISDNKSVSFSNIPGWFSRTNERGWDWLMCYDKDGKNVYVSLTCDIPLNGNAGVEQLSDRYEVYHFDGNEFIYQHISAGYWLNFYLADFKYLEVVGEIGEHTIRIDRMIDGSFRYASWRETSDMTLQPSLVVSKGTFDENSRSYTFVNDEYSYIVGVNDDGDQITSLEVKHNDETIKSFTK
ncbi:MAG: hypothetical protein IKW83_09825 [Muribaculaceae bacterium]|nr:hypothetical protein [Muribaculaceae bacterium]